MPNDDKPLSEQIIHGLKSRPWIAYLVVFSTVIGGIAAATDSASKLWNFVESMYHGKDFEHPTSEAELKANLIKMSHEGCYFFRWDSSAIEEVPKDVFFAQEGYFDQLMGAKTTFHDEQVFIYGYVEPNYSSSYAMGLSLRRANALKDYLVKKHQLDPMRIATIGKGREVSASKTAHYFCGAVLSGPR
ncbi:MAG: OmpA family protein [Alphaproteobacteria bacterium]|nr:OmpA family protein [Alphaproteobacteria bacterium]